jgi:erythronate-4-phosphate dehydrogenase
MKRRLKIVVDENMPLVADVLQDHADLEYYPGRLINKQAVSEVDALLIRSVTKVSSSMLETSSCQFIGTATIGTDHIAQAVKDSSNVKVVSAPGCNAQSVAEYVLSAVLHYLSTNNVTKKGKAKSSLNNINKLTVGIVGGGNTGTAVARTLRLLGFTCLIYDPILKTELSTDKHEGKEPYCSWSDIEQADIVSLHVPYTSSGEHPTAKMINEQNISDFNAELLINACRGGVLTSQAVINEAPKGKISFILDVFEGEPNVNQKEMSLALLCTPHVAGYSRNGKLAGSIQVIEALCHHFKLPLNEIPILKYTAIDLTIDNPNLNKEYSDDKVKNLAAFATWWKVNVYDITADDKNFRQSAENFPSAFDQLRKNYTHRDEVGFDELVSWFSSIYKM